MVLSDDLDASDRDLPRPGVQCCTAGVTDFVMLLKPRVMSLVLFTSLVGLVVAPGTLHPLMLLTSMLCISAGAGAAGALNMWYDADIDVVMRRTADRPVPGGRISPGEALAFGLILACMSVLLLGVLVNWISAFLLAFTIFFYLVIYTMWLKRWTPQNIVIGGISGALPPVIGWAAATGEVSLESFFLFLIIFAWTPPHSWALALFSSQDYERAGVPMLSVVAGSRKTRMWIVLYALLLLPIGMTPWFLGLGGYFFGISALVLGGIFLGLALNLLACKDLQSENQSAKRLFLFSLFYLFLIYALLLVDYTFVFSGAV